MIDAGAGRAGRDKRIHTQIYAYDILTYMAPGVSVDIVGNRFIIMKWLVFGCFL